jgi:hypothetical protein
LTVPATKCGCKELDCIANNAEDIVVKCIVHFYPWGKGYRGVTFDASNCKFVSKLGHTT